ncbi:MAG: hypothetical protein IH845_02960 [Nanoarchaeota archaeon]|nr:hypothetical protein [Nanoarchaeota archaeon]
MTRYEIHVNAKTIHKNIESKLLEFGFSSDPFLPTGLAHTPTNHFTWEAYNNPKSRKLTWDKTRLLLSGDITFQGYAESETVSEGHIVKFHNPNSFNYTAEFPLQRLDAVQLAKGHHKSSDIHIKRGLDLKRDVLDTLLLNNGFYEVHTPRNRIFTLHAEWIGDAKTIFSKLKDYFLESKSVKEMRLEVVSGFYKSPNFPVADAIQKGGI